MLPAVLRALQTLIDAYRAPLASATRTAALAWLVAGVVGGAHLARYGTLSTRLLAGLVLVAALGALGARYFWLRRSFRSEPRAIATVLVSTQRELGERALRAQRLLSRSPEQRGGESQDLARWHYERLLQRASVAAVVAAATRRARGWRGFGVVLFAAAGVALVLAPVRVFEGLNVLVARQGVAPWRMEWLELPTITAQPPAYLGYRTALLNLQSASMLPEGTELSVRGRPAWRGRHLVLTDGRAEVPFVEDGRGSLVAHWELQESVELRVAARFGDVLIHEPRSVQLYSQVDQPPAVRLAEAPAEHELKTLEQLPLRWSAADDHGLVQVDLVLRSGGREERRVLERFPSDMRQGSGGHILFPNDPFLARVFLPVTVRIEARDNDPREGSKWGQSEAIVLHPPTVGAAQAERLAALMDVRARLVDLLVRHNQPPEFTQHQERARFDAASREQVAQIINAAHQALTRSYAGLEFPQGWFQFTQGQLQKLQQAHERRRSQLEVTEEVLLALDSALQTLANGDAREVAKQLGDVAEEAAFGARLAQERAERAADGRERLALAVRVLATGAEQLLTMGVLGADLGSVAQADLGRVRRSVEREDFFHAELAALHMAARLHRPNPSFGAKGGGGGGVESGAGHSGGSQSDAQGSASDADSDFDRLARDLQQLAQEHSEVVDRTAAALRDAQSAVDQGSVREEVRERAEALRRSVVRLPQPGEAPGTSRASAALAREHTGAMAHELERLGFEAALESGRRARAAAQEALRDAQLDEFSRQQLERALGELDEQMQWVRQQHDRAMRLREEAARDALRDISHLEQELAERARRLLDERDERVALPQQIQERLGDAQQLMRDAARRLNQGRGEHGLDLQRQAQRLLEESELGETSEGSGAERSDDAQQERGRSAGTGGPVPDPDGRADAADFRKRVLDGLGRRSGSSLAPAVKRYAEGLLR